MLCSSVIPLDWRMDTVRLDRWMVYIKYKPPRPSARKKKVYPIESCGVLSHKAVRAVSDAMPLRVYVTLWN